MNTKKAIGFLCGSIVVHAVVTACTSTSGSVATRDASAQTPSSPTDTAPLVSPETCNATYEGQLDPFNDAGTQTVSYSEHAYSGKSKAEIAAHVTHWTEIDDPVHEGRPPVYQGGLNLQTAVYVRDGFAGAGCTVGKTGYFVWR